MFAFAQPRRARKPSLTPMIDVVFLLLVFFMLAARFGGDMALPLAASGGGAAGYEGPPRLVTVQAGGALTLNGRAVALDDLAARLAPLMDAPGDMVVLRPKGAATVQDLVAVADSLRAAGLGRLIVVEGE